MGKMHAARVADSPRLQSIVDFLRRRGSQGATTWEICQECRALNVSTYASEIRANGYVITTAEESSSEGGRKVFRYVLVAEPQPQQLLIQM
jgi:phage-related protein